MVYTEHAPREKQFHVAPATSVDIQKPPYKKLVTHVESPASAGLNLSRTTLS